MGEKNEFDNGNQNSDVPMTGGCLCGAVRYESSEPPVEVAYCHCRRCQRAYGNPFGVFAFISVTAFKITRGEPKYYWSSAWAKRGFCAECGTPLVFRDSTQNIGILVSTLDHPEDWPPTLCHSGMESRIEWDKIGDDLPRWRTRNVRPPGKSPLLDMVRHHDQRQESTARTRLSSTTPSEVSRSTAEAGGDELPVFPGPEGPERALRRVMEQQVATDKKDSGS
jgi:hypothetical protein